MSAGTSLKDVLMKSWRERWSEARWSIAIQNFVKTHKDRDILAKSLFDQIMIGSSTNVRFLLYIKYSLHTNIISYSTTLRCLAATKRNARKSLIFLLVHFLDNLLIGIGRSSEDPLQLAESLLVVLQWLSRLMSRFLCELQTSNGDSKALLLLEHIIAIILTLTSEESLAALLFVASKQSFDGIEVEQLEAAYSKLSSSKHSELRSKCKEVITKLKKVGHFKINNERSILSKNPLLLHLISCVECLFLNSDLSTCVSNYKLIQKLQNLDTLDLYIEIIWSGVVGMLQSHRTEHEIKWICFLYVKLPNIMQKLQSQHHKDNLIEQAFLRLIANKRLFDLLDHKYQCNCLNYLLVELKTRSLISDPCRISSKRETIMIESSCHFSLNSILKSNEAIHAVIKSLDTDISNNLDAIISTLHNLISTNTYEYNLLTLSSNGLSNRICDHLIKVNECCKELIKTSESNPKKTIQIFDITFMLLCDITQRYKYKPLSGNKECFFLEWSRNYLSNSTNLCRISKDTSESLVNHVMSYCLEDTPKPISLSKLSLPKVYAAVVQSAKFTINALSSNAIDEKCFNRLFECVRATQHSLCLYLTYWLHQFKGPLATEHQNIVNKAIAILKLPQDIYSHNDTNKLKLVIVSKHIHTTNKIVEVSTSSVLVKEKFAILLKKGTIDSPTMEFFSSLVTLYGTNPCAMLICQELLLLTSIEELNKGVSIAAAIFHLNISAFTLSLIKHVLPKLLMNCKLLNPMSTSILNLIMFCVCIYFNNRKGRRSSKKRSISEVDPENDEDASKKHTNSTKNRNRKSEDEISDSFVSLFKLFLEILKHNRMSTIVGFIKSFFQTLMAVPSEIASMLLKLVPVDLILLLQKYLPDLGLHFATSGDFHSGRSNRRKFATYVCRYSQNSRFSLQ